MSCGWSQGKRTVCRIKIRQTCETRLYFRMNQLQLCIASVCGPAYLQVSESDFTFFTPKVA
jgi:hypothetical protein